MADVLEVKVSWGSQVLMLRHLAPGETFAIGDGGDVALPNLERTPIVAGHHAGWIISSPRGDVVDLRPGMRVSMDVEGVTIDIATVRAEKSVGRGFLGALLTGITAALFVSSVAHATALATTAHLDVPAATEEGVSREQLLAMKVLLEAALERETEERVEDEWLGSGPPQRDFRDALSNERWEPFAGEPWGPPVENVQHVREGDVSSTGKLPLEVIQQIVRQSFARFRACYETELRRHPKLEGVVTTNIIIGRDGEVKHVVDGGSDLPNDEVVACVGRRFKELSFPKPEAGIVTASYPIAFQPGE